MSRFELTCTCALCQQGFCAASRALPSKSPLSPPGQLGDEGRLAMGHCTPDTSGALESGSHRDAEVTAATGRGQAWRPLGCRECMYCLSPQAQAGLAAALASGNVFGRSPSAWQSGRLAHAQLARFPSQAAHYLELLPHRHVQRAPVLLPLPHLRTAACTQAGTPALCGASPSMRISSGREVWLLHRRHVWEGGVKAATSKGATAQRPSPRQSIKGACETPEHAPGWP